jgi:hypothetical protein
MWLVGDRGSRLNRNRGDVYLVTGVLGFIATIPLAACGASGTKIIIAS